MRTAVFDRPQHHARGRAQGDARLAIENDFQLCTHAIGDRANREILDIYEQALAAHPEKKDLRWRVEHAQHLAGSDIPRFGVSDHRRDAGDPLRSDGPWIRRSWARRGQKKEHMSGVAPQRGAMISNGTDAPVEDIDPIPSFTATVTRKMKDGHAFFPEQRLSREEALRTYTLGGATAAFQEDLLGSLKAGKLADITVLSKDILSCPRRNPGDGGPPDDHRRPGRFPERLDERLED